MRSQTQTPSATTDGQTTSSATTTSDADAGAEPDANASPPGAPETYTDFTLPADLPEGAKIDKARIAEAIPIFKELGLSQAQAQRLVEFAAKNQVTDLSTGSKLVSDMHAEWATKLAADPEIGSKLPAVKVEIGRALAHLGPEAEASFRSAMDLTGAGNHPDVIKGLNKLASMVNEGRPVTGSGPSPLGQERNGQPQRSSAQKFYPNLPSATS